MTNPLSPPLLQLVQVSPDEVRTLIELVQIFPTENQKDLLAGLIQISEWYAKNPKEVKIRMIFPKHLMNELRQVLNSPLLPMDADRHGIPVDRYLQLTAESVPLVRKVAFPEASDPLFLTYNAPAPSTALLN